jgi:hypothetical protein
MDIDSLQRRLLHLSSSGIQTELTTLSDQDLLILIDSEHSRIGDAAAEMVWSRRQVDILIDAILAKVLKTRIGKTRATSILHREGRHFPRSAVAYVALLGDRSAGVVSNALFGLVFLQDVEHLKAVEEEGLRRPEGSKVHERFRQAAEALRKRDPFLFAPHFRDASRVWTVDPARFPDGQPR